MKRSMKKLAVFVMIGAIAIFIVAATASAFDRDDHRNRIEGQYAATSSGTCFIAVCGFAGNNVPNHADLGVYQYVTYTSMDEYTFHRGGTGHVTMKSSNVITPSTTPAVPYPSAGIDIESFDFTYVIGGGGAITITQKGDGTSKWTSGPLNGTTDTVIGYARTGTISPDGATIVLNGGLPGVISIPTIQTPPFCASAVVQMICSYSAVLILQHD